MCLRPPRSPLFPYTTLFRSFEDLLSLVLDAFATSRTFSHQSLTRCRTPSPLFGLGRGRGRGPGGGLGRPPAADRKSTRLNSSHTVISYAVFCLKKKNNSVLP